MAPRGLPRVSTVLLKAFFLTPADPSGASARAFTSYPQKALLDRLRSRVEVDRARAEGRLLESDGFSSVEEAYRFFEDRFFEAVADGWGAIRVLGDMAWMVDAGLDEANMTAFEMRYEHFLAKQFPVVSLCQYDARRFSGVELLHALTCHTDAFDQPGERFLAG